jgi:hypothetical protein
MYEAMYRHDSYAFRSPKKEIELNQCLFLIKPTT